MRRFILPCLLLCSVLAMTVEVQPNFVRAAPGESFGVKVLIRPDSNGFYSVKAQGCGISVSRDYELLFGQTFEIPLTATAPAEPGTYEITAMASIGGISASGTSTVDVVSLSGQAGTVNATLVQVRMDMQELARRAEAVGDEPALSRLLEAELRLNKSESSYEHGYLISAQEDLSSAQSIMGQARTLVEFSERSRWNVNLSLLGAGVLILLIAFVLSAYMKKQDGS